MSDNKKRQRAEATPLPVYQKYGPHVMTTHDGSKTASQTMAFGIMTVLPNFTLDQLVIISAHFQGVKSSNVDEGAFMRNKDAIQPDLRTLLISHISWWLSYLYFDDDDNDADVTPRDRMTLIRVNTLVFAFMHENEANPPDLSQIRHRQELSPPPPPTPSSPKKTTLSRYG
jgi:hypothetical protein